MRDGNVAGTVGTGGGLYLVKPVVELHRDTLSVNSVEGQGSRCGCRAWRPSDADSGLPVPPARAWAYHQPVTSPAMRTSTNPAAITR